MKVDISFLNHYKNMYHNVYCKCLSTHQLSLLYIRMSFYHEEKQLVTSNILLVLWCFYGPSSMNIIRIMMALSIFSCIVVKFCINGGIFIQTSCTEISKALKWKCIEAFCGTSRKHIKSKSLQKAFCNALTESINEACS